MKKILISLAIIASMTVFGQKGIILSEDFSNTNFPPTGWTIDAHEANWSRSSTTNCGGVSPEMKFTYSPTFTGISRVISPVINLTGITELRLSFKHMIDHYGGDYTVGVATTIDGGTTWNDVYSVVGASLAETVDTLITNSDIGSSTFQICFYFSGNSYNINNWYIDNFLLYNPSNLDATLSSIPVNSYIESGEIAIKSEIFNIGKTTITNATLSYSVDEATPISQTFSNLTIATGEKSTLAFETKFNATPGDHTIKVYIQTINGSTDSDITNDTIVKTTHTATQTVARTPIFEEFTSSTCAPCASFNSSVMNSFCQTHNTEMTYIKYQMNWPGSGDIYYTEDGGMRRAYYGVGGVPDLYGAGTEVSTSQASVDASLSAQLAKQAFMSINANHTINKSNSTITVNADITPYFNGENFTAYIAIFENVTTGNVGNNGETEFHHVMMKMLPDGNGTSLTFVAGQTQPLSFNDIDLTSTNIEDINDINVLVFVQNDMTKKIFQSTYSTENANGYSTKFKIINNNLQPIISALININNTDSLTTNSQGEAIIYGIDSASVLSYTVSNINYNDTTGTTTIISDTTITVTLSDKVGISSINSDSYTIYPNPAKSNFVISGHNISKIEIYNIQGQLIKHVSNYANAQISTTNLPNGSYFVKIINNTKAFTKRLVITH